VNSCLISTLKVQSEIFVFHLCESDYPAVTLGATQGSENVGTVLLHCETGRRGQGSASRARSQLVVPSHGLTCPAEALFRCLCQGSQHQFHVFAVVASVRDGRPGQRRISCLRRPNRLYGPHRLISAGYRGGLFFFFIWTMRL
jgi:hypothetical protein